MTRSTRTNSNAPTKPSGRPNFRSEMRLDVRDLMRAIGYSSATAWMFPAIIDIAVAVSTLMLVALGDKPARRARTVTTPANTQPQALQRLARTLTGRAIGEVAPTTTSARAHTVKARRVPDYASIHPRPAQAVQASAQTAGARGDAEIAQVDTDLASELIASGVTTQPVVTVIAVLTASRAGASINASAKASGIYDRTAQRIVEAAAERRQGQLVAAS